MWGGKRGEAGGARVLQKEAGKRTGGEGGDGRAVLLLLLPLLYCARFDPGQGGESKYTPVLYTTFT